MNSEPPSEINATQDEGIARESPDPGGNQGRGRWASVAAALGALAVAGGVAAFLFLSSDSDPPADQATPLPGLACPDLRAAVEAYEQGDSALFDRTIAQAAKVAEETLQKSGQAFGEPERIALELELSLNQSPTRIERLLELAIRDCQDLEPP